MSLVSIFPRSLADRRTRLVLPAVTVIWLLACVAGLAALWRYKATPGPDGSPPARWPDAAAIARVPGQPTLLMLVHPRCACSRASLHELNEVMNRVRGVSATILFVQPDGTDDAWVRGDSWERAHEIPNAQVVIDRGGREARRFRVAASGHTLLYDAGGRLVFSGGVTGARGHEGNNAGRQQLFAALRGERAGSSRVFGCALAEQR